MSALKKRVAFFGVPVGSVNEEMEFSPEERFVRNTRMHQK